MPEVTIGTLIAATADQYSGKLIEQFLLRGNVEAALDSMNQVKSAIINDHTISDELSKKIKDNAPFTDINDFIIRLSKES